MGYHAYDYEYKDTYIKSRRAAKTKAAPPPLNDDDAKIARHEQQGATDLRNAIRDAGEGGWRSPWYVGPSDHVHYAQGYRYAEWQAARENWTVTGDPDHLVTMLTVVDFANPPGEHEIKLLKPSAKKRNVWRKVPGLAGMAKAHPLAVVGVSYFVAMAILSVLMSVFP